MLVGWFQEEHPQNHLKRIDVKVRLADLLNEIELIRTICSFVKKHSGGGVLYELSMALGTRGDIFIALIKDQPSTDAK